SRLSFRHPNQNLASLVIGHPAPGRNLKPGAKTPHTDIILIQRTDADTRRAHGLLRGISLDGRSRSRFLITHAQPGPLGTSDTVGRYGHNGPHWPPAFSFRAQ